MLYKFLINNRADLEKRCRDKVSRRPGRSPPTAQLQNGVPMFLNQLIRTLQSEEEQDGEESNLISGEAGGAATSSEVGASAAQHGKDLLALGFSVDEVVHDYGDLCQAITDLAVERDAPFQVNEFRTLNRCLDTAIANAVTEFGYQQGLAAAEVVAQDTIERASFFAHELRNLLGTATLAFSAAKTGNLSLSGATGSILERSLASIARLIEESVIDIRALGQHTAVLSSFSMGELIGELAPSAEIAALKRGCTFAVADVDSTLAISGNRELLLAALDELVGSAIESTDIGTEVRLSAHAVGNKIQIDVADHRTGGCVVEDAQTRPLADNARGRRGLGNRISVAEQSILASGGTLGVREIPKVGCIFTITMPRLSIPT